jgi:hypothetical protein
MISDEREWRERKDKSGVENIPELVGTCSTREADNNSSSSRKRRGE